MTEMDRALADLAERLRKEAYASGWNDAMAAVRSALETASSKAEDARPAETKRRPGRPRLVRNEPPVSRGRGGSTPAHVLEIVSKRPGISGAEVVAAMRQAHPEAREPTVRVALARLGKRKQIVNRRMKWFAA